VARSSKADENAFRSWEYRGAKQARVERMRRRCRKIVHDTIAEVGGVSTPNVTEQIRRPQSPRGRR